MKYQWIRDLSKVGNSSHFAWAAKLGLQLQILVFSLVFSAVSGANPTPPGTVISNIANSSQQVGPTLQSAATNQVNLTVGSIAVIGAPTLTKAFSAAAINAGTSTPLTFTITNVAGNPAQAGIAFTDTLPAALQLSAAATGTVGGAGCTGTVTLTAPATIAVSALAMTAGTASCTVTVNSVTNVAGQSNDACTSNPAAFTNGPANIVALANLTNAVTSQCLVVKVLVIDSIVAKCINDTPYVDYTVHTVGVSGLTTVNIDWQKIGGGSAMILPNQPFTGRLLWPGAAVDSSGNPTAWPGWQFTGGQWVQINDGLRPDMNLVFTVNPTTTATVSYPPATPTCNANPTQVPSATLTKAFAQSTIADGDTTALVFTVTSAAGNPGRSGITFTDMLPSGLALATSPTGVIGAGCTGNVSYIAPNTISVSNFMIMTGTASCTVTVTGITNRNGALNANGCSAANEPAFTNDTNSIGNLTGINSNVTPQCLRVVPAMPTLTKQFAAARIADGDTTKLTFAITNSNLAPAVSGLAFTDTLPAGLQLTASASYALQGTGCTGQVTLSPSQISVTGYSMAAGSRYCYIVVDGVSNAAGQLNASCASSPANFTNSAASISAVSGLLNNVQPACLAVDAQDPALRSVTVVKSISAVSGASPSSPYTVKLSVKNASAASNAGKTNLVVADALPVGMNYVPGSLKLTSGSTVQSLGNSGGVFTLGTRNGVYDTTGNKITISFSTFQPGEQDDISFDVAIAAGLALNSVLPNTAQFSYTDSQLNAVGPKYSNTVNFTVTDTTGVTLRGQTLASVDPGSTVTFENLLTNTGSKIDTFDITLTGSTFPAGTVLHVYQSDGVTPLADSNGNGIADTGPVPPGGAYKIIVTAALPAGVAGGPYKVRKNAQSINNPLVKAADDDVVSTITKSCKVVVEPDNTGHVAPGDSIVYTHTVTNTGVCDETIGFPANFLGNGAGWSAQVVIDNPVAGGQSIVGVFDSTDTSVGATTTFPLPAGARALLLVKVTSPSTATNGAVNVTTFTVNAGSSGPQVVHDTTTVSTSTSGNNILQGYIDPSFQRPTVWATISQNFYLKATAPACVSNPTIVEHHTVIITGPNGEHEELIATETAPGSGIFVVDNIPVRAPPVMPGDGVIEGLPYDTLNVEIIGCSAKITTTVTLVDPNGVVFDSVTDAPVPNSSVTLLNTQGGQCTATPASVTQLVSGAIVPAANPVLTGADGRFTFPLVSPGDYCLKVGPPNGYTWTSTVPASRLPAGRNILATGPTTGGSYGGVFHLGPETGPVIVDIPVDGGKIAGLFVQKTSLRTVVEIGEFNDYVVTISNNTGYDLNRADVLVTDNLPFGFSYVAGTAQADGKPLADPTGKGGAQITFDIGRMVHDQQIKLTYRVRIGPGATKGDGINRVYASYQPGTNSSQYSQSNTATAQVTVNDGVFTDQGFITGKIFTDCNQNGIQDAKEVGVPGVRLYLEDGTNVTSDAEGKYSFYGISPRTHVLKIDRQTLPVGVTVRDLIPLSSRNLGKGDSQIVDLQNGELHKSNFAIQSCTEPVMAEISQRRLAAAALQTEVDGRLQQKLSTDTTLKTNADLKALPATGTVGASGVLPGVAAPQDGTGAGATTKGTSGFQTIAPPPAKPAVSEAERQKEEEENLLENLLPKQNNTLDFMGLKDGDVLAYAQSTIRVKGTAETTFKLTVNDHEIPATRVGKKAVLAEKQLQAWEYIGVDLLAGNNTITVSQIDQFGNARGTKTIKVVAPGALAKVTIEYPPVLNGGGVADGRTIAKVIVRLADANNVPITTRTAVTLTSTLGRWNVEDLNGVEPGVQTYIEGGRAEFPLMPPSEPGQAEITVSAGTVKGQSKLDFLPDLRDMIAAGVIEGVLNLRKLNTNALTPARSQDGFEQEITHLARTWNDGKVSGEGRAALFLKGKVKGEYLLTLSYDSDKDTQTRLFRDIQPDQFYPIYGDSSVRSFDAQSTGKFYVRIDNKKSYLLYGDYNTSQSSDVRKLSNYNRSLTGIKEHYENAKVNANVFASRDSTTQVVDELAANGTSGPFVLSNIKGLVVNSEKVEVLTRDRNQTAVVLTSVALTAFVDYSLEPLTGNLLLKAPVPTLDDKLNPMSLRITYEVDQGGKEFWVAGGDAQVKLTDKLEVGGMFVDDQNPLNKFRMAGINAIAKLADKTFIMAELAQTRNNNLTDGTGLKQGLAERIEYKQQTDNIEASLYAGRAAADFNNPSSSLSSGRSEAGGKLAYRIDDKNRINAELLHTEDTVANAKRDGISITGEHQFVNGMRFEAGLRYARDNQAAAAAVPGSTVAPLTEVTSVRARLSGDIPGIKGASGYGEAEVDTQDASKKLLAVGTDYKLPGGGKLYARHEFISSLNGPFALNGQQQQNSSVIGVSTDYMKDGNVFSEYRVRDALAGGDAEAALGLRNTWTLREGVKLQTGFERVHVLSGTNTSESTAMNLGIEYTANPLWKGSARLELREGQTSDSVLATVAAATKLNREWTFLGRNTYALTRNKGSQTGENLQDRMQAGVAYRDTDSDVWTGLARVEHRTENDTTQPDIILKRTVELFSINANWQPRRPFTLATRYAVQWTNENSNGIASKNNAQLVSARAIWDFAPRWDVSLNASTMFGNGAQTKYYGFGVELGYMVMENLWVSAGYNFFGYNDNDLSSGEYTNKGVFLRLRYKFDEDLFATRSQKSAADKSATQATSGPVATSGTAAGASAANDNKGGAGS